jgi:flagellar assembly protein FliH
MASIIRSPAISEERRKLTTRRTRAKADVAPAEAAVEPAKPAVAAPQAAPSAAPAPSVPAQAAAPAPAPVPDVARLVEQARDAVIAQFKGEAEKARELGRERGLQEGRDAGAEEVRASFEGELARVRSIADRLGGAVETGIAGLEDVAVAIAFEALCKLLGTSAVTPDGIRALVREAAAHAINNEKVVVRVHPGDLATLKSAGTLEAALPSGTAVSWIADKGVELGGCVVETDSGELDARLETQIEKLRQTLVAARRLGT